MRFIIEIADTIRQGVYPAVDVFQYSSEFEAYIYLGRTLDLDEFNTAAARVFHPFFRGQGFTFRPVAIPDCVPAVTAAAIPPDAPLCAERFQLQGADIYEGGERVGGLFEPGPHLRVAKGRADLRPDLEQWLETLKQLQTPLAP